MQPTINIWIRPVNYSTCIHEAPNATPANNNPLPLGAAVSAEPGIYLPGRFGVRIEDVLVLQEGGCMDITLAKKDLTIL